MQLKRSTVSFESSCDLCLLSFGDARGGLYQCMYGESYRVGLGGAKRNIDTQIFTVIWFNRIWLNSMGMRIYGSAYGINDIWLNSFARMAVQSKQYPRQSSCQVF